MNDDARDDGQVAGDKTRGDLKNLLSFTSELLSAREPPVFDISSYPVRIQKSDLLAADGAPLPGVHFGPTDDVWLTIDRLRERRPPAVPEELEGWVRISERAGPDEPPSLMQELAVVASPECASDLIEAELVETGDLILASQDTSTEHGEVVPWDESVELILRSAKLPDVLDAYRTYINGPWKIWAEEEKVRRRSIRIYKLACPGFGGHRVRCHTGTGGRRWLREGPSVASSSLRR